MNKKQFILNILVIPFVLSSFILFISCGSNATKTQTDNTASPSKTKIDKEQGQPYYFWKVEKQGKTSYWLGTVHIGISLFDLPCSYTIIDKLKNSDLCFTENAHNNNINDQDLESLFFTSNNEDFNQLDSDSQLFIARNNISKKLNHFGYVSLVNLMCIKEALGPLAIHKTMDKQVEEMAHSQGIPIKALDTLDTMTSATDSFTKEDTIKKIRGYSQCIATKEDRINKYKTGKIPLDEKISTQFAEQTLKDRNEKWMTKFLSAYNNYNNIFVAVGLGHFIWPFNLIDMLKKEGFTVEQMSCSNNYRL